MRSPLAANPGLALVHGWSACCASLERLAFGLGPLPKVGWRAELPPLPPCLARTARGEDLRTSNLQTARDRGPSTLLCWPLTGLCWVLVYSVQTARDGTPAPEEAQAQLQPFRPSPLGYFPRVPVCHGGAMSLARVASLSCCAHYCVMAAPVGLRSMGSGFCDSAALGGRPFN